MTSRKSFDDVETGNHLFPLFLLPLSPLPFLQVGVDFVFRRVGHRRVVRRQPIEHVVNLPGPHWQFIFSIKLQRKWSFVNKVPGAVFTILYFITNGQGKLESFSLAGLSCLVWYLWIRLEHTWVKHHSGAPLKYKLLALNTNNRLGFKGLPWTNNLEYYKHLKLLKYFS